MASVVRIWFPVIAEAAARHGMPMGGRRRVTLKGERGFVVTLPLTNPEVDYAGLAPVWVPLERPGNKPLLVKAGRPLRTQHLEVTAMADDQVSGIEEVLEALVGLAEEEAVTIGYGPWESSRVLNEAGHWVISDLSYRSAVRQPGTHAITRAVVSIELTEGSPVPWLVAQRGPAGPLPALPGPLPKRTRPDIVVLAAGEDLISLAVRYYGDARFWPAIAELNGIRDPRAVTPGMEIRMP